MAIAYVLTAHLSSGLAVKRLERSLRAARSEGDSLKEGKGCCQREVESC